jgi:hypothetical protein
MKWNLTNKNVFREKGIPPPHTYVKTRPAYQVTTFVEVDMRQIATCNLLAKLGA